MDVVKRIAQRHQSVLRPHRIGQRIGDASCNEAPRVADDLVHPFCAQQVAQLFGRRVDALHAAFGLAGERLLDGLQLGVGHLQQVAVECRTSEYEVLASDFDAFFDPLDALEPDQFGLARRILCIGVEPSPASLAGIRNTGDAGAELHVGQSGGIGDFGDGVDARAVDIAERIVPQHVAECADPQLVLQCTGPHFAYSRDELDVVIERIFHEAKGTNFFIR